MNLLSLIFLLLLPASNIPDVVRKFHDLKSKELEKLFIQNYSQSNEPSIIGYVYAVEMKQAEYSYNPITKFKVFNTTKKKLNSLVTLNPSNVHLRYIRLMLQEKTPGILGYNQFIEEDKSFITEKLKMKDESDYLDVFIHKNTSL